MIGKKNKKDSEEMMVYYKGKKGKTQCVDSFDHVIDGYELDHESHKKNETHSTKVTKSSRHPKIRAQLELPLVIDRATLNTQHTQTYQQENRPNK
jgi:pyruvate dehydrogenase complex dehydrogenase (E1) component